MKISNKYSILKEIGLVIQFHNGDITLESIQELKKAIVSDKDYKPEYVFIVDMRKGNVLLSDSDIENEGDKIIEHMKLKGRKRIALLTNKPNQVVIATTGKNNCY